ncbi:MAG: hypothetical protein K0Q66_1464 [Chitinophagaceae bacterium]|jgi:hypothetical protein|nr:hypothetical protein [Chitinophagaceae bacterium]
MKKAIIISILLAVLSTTAFSQVSASLTVTRPSATLSEWANNGTITYVVDVPPAITRQVIIKATLKTTDGTVVATKDLSKAQVFTVQGTRIFFAKDVIPLDIMTFTGSYKTTLEKTGKLPAGTYQLEVQLVEPGLFGPLSTVQTRIFNLAAPQLPVLIKPIHNDSLEAKQSETSIIFRWTPLSPRTQDLPYYRLQVFEVLPYQQPMQALRGNQPILDQLLRNQTQYIWRPQMSFSTDTTGKKFIWTVQTLDANQQPYVQTTGNGESRSEPFVFYVKEGNGASEK